MSAFKENRLKDLLAKHNGYVTLINKADFKKSTCIEKLSIYSCALEAASKVLEYTEKNFTVRVK